MFEILEHLPHQESFHITEIKLLMFDQKDQKSYSLHIDKLIRSKRKQLIIPYLDKMFKLLKEHVPEKDWNSKQGILDDDETFEAKMVSESHTCDPEDLESSTYFKVFKLGSNKPVWLIIHQVPPLCLRHFLFRLRNYVYVLCWIIILETGYIAIVVFITKNPLLYIFIFIC